MTNEENEQVLHWNDAIERFGTPIESSIPKDEEWESAKNENRVISLFRGDDLMDYRGKVGLLTEDVLYRVVFPKPLPPDILITNVRFRDIGWDFSKPAEEVHEATERLMSACCEGDVKEMQSAIAAGGNIDYCEHRATIVRPLTLALRNHHKKCVEVLLDAGANIAYDAEELWRWAILLGWSDLLGSLEQRGVRAVPQDAILHAAHEGKCDVIRKLVDAGADINESDWVNLYESVQGICRTVKGTPLTVAALAGQEDVIDLLLNLGADVNCRDVIGLTPWAAAAARGFWDLCSNLESRGAQTDPQTALLYAARVGNTSAFRRAIGLGADPNRLATIDDREFTPLEAALESDEIGKYSQISESDDQTVLESLRCATIAELISCGSDCNSTPPEGRLPILLAVDIRNANAIDLFLEHGVSVDKVGKDGDTALLAAAGYEEYVAVDCAKKLLLAGADPNAVDRQGLVPLMRLLMSWKKQFACDNDWSDAHVELAKWLIAFGARLDGTCRKGKSIPQYVKRVITEAKKNDIDIAEITQFREWISNEDLMKTYSGIFAKHPKSAEDCLSRAYCAINWLEDPELASREMDRAADFGCDVREAVSSWDVDMACQIALMKCQIDNSQTQAMIRDLSSRIPEDEDSLSGQEAFAAATIRGTLGDIKVILDNFEGALGEYEVSVRLNPSLQEGRWDGLIQAKEAFGDERLKRAVRLYSEGHEFSECGDYAAAADAYRKAIDEDPQFPWAYNNLAWQMATCPDADIRDPKTAVELAKKASQLSGDRYHGILDTLAAAYAEAGNFVMAAEVTEGALSVAPDDARSEYEFNYGRYRSGQKWAPYEGDKDPEEDV